MTQRYFVLDTNVLLHTPECLRQFADNTLVIPVDVIEELDNFKTRNDELGRNARAVIRIIDNARQEASGAGATLATGVPVNDEGGTLQVDLKPVCLLEDGLRDDTPDNRIISVAYRLKREGFDVAIISKDVAMRVKSDALGIPAEDFESDKVPALDRMYMGWRTVHVNNDDVVRLQEEGRVTLTLEEPAFPNEAILLRDRDNPKSTALGRPVANWAGGTEVELRPFLSSNQAVQGIAPRNLEQRVALELLLDRSVNLVTLVGKAGTGKTLLALVAGLYQTTKKHQYEKLLVSRPVMPLGRDIGYLPGTAEEKLMPWLKPIFDNMKFILRERTPGEADKKIMELFKSGIVDVEPLTFIRGRSIHHQFMVVDECQNLTPHQIRTIISRVGHDTKLVLTGDPYQIDNPYLDSRSNGLTYVAERMKTQGVAGHVSFTKSERSLLASVAVEIL